MKKTLIALAMLASCSPETSSPPPNPPPARPEPAAEEPVRPPRQAVELIKFAPPSAWTREEPASNMRKAQYRVPDKEKTGKDAEMVLFYFGPRNDMLQANLDRWASQMGADDPRPRTIEGKCKVTLVDLSGSYTGDQDAGTQENSRLIAAVVEAADGPWYFKLVGPADTVTDWRDEYLAMLLAAAK